MENLNLITQLRTTEEKLSEIRNSKMIPSIVYGKHQEPILIKIDYSDFLRTFRKSGKSHIINLQTEKGNIEVLVHEVQKAPVKGDFIHIDFFAITKGEKLHTSINLKFVGTSQAVKEGAILDEHIKEVEVKILPKDLVDFIEVDLSILKEIGDTIRVSELNIDTSKIEILTPDDIVVSASKPAKIEVEAIVTPTTENTLESKS